MTPTTPTNCNCAEMTCKEECTRNHTHKGFSCHVCRPQDARYPTPTNENWVESFYQKYVYPPRDYMDKDVADMIIEDLRKMREDIRAKMSQEKKALIDRVEEWKIELAERIVIDYANLSGRESANRATFRNKVIEHLDTLLTNLRKDI